MASSSSTRTWLDLCRQYGCYPNNVNYVNLVYFDNQARCSEHNICAGLSHSLHLDHIPRRRCQSRLDVLVLDPYGREWLGTHAIGSIPGVGGLQVGIDQLQGLLDGELAEAAGAQPERQGLRQAAVQRKE